MRILLALVCLAVSFTNAFAARAEFKFLRTVTVAELNSMLAKERTKFLKDVTQGEDYVLPPASHATNDVNLFTVRYYSSVPEQDGKEVAATGLLALPKIANRANIPLISYQHGTVMSLSEVPSRAFTPDNPTMGYHYDGSYETRLMTALFAGNGYAVMAADYFGMGGGTKIGETYMMKDSEAQASYDLYLDVMSFLATRNIVPGNFFLGGWSLGGLNTTGLLEKMEAEGVNVRAVFTAASPNDPYAALNAVLFHPRATDASWITAILGLSTFACERTLGIKGLAKEVINPDDYNNMKGIYERTIPYPLGVGQLFQSWQGRSFISFIRPSMRSTTKLANSDFGKCLAAGETYRREFKAPVHMYYGSVDEVIRPKIGLLARDYQAVITDTPDVPPSSKVKAFRVEGGGHRGTFIRASNDAKAWMDSLR